LTPLVDDVVLSCEVGHAKPDRMIYQEALRRLSAAREQTLLIDDQQSYCDGAATPQSNRQAGAEACSRSSSC